MRISPAGQFQGVRMHKFRGSFLIPLVLMAALVQAEKKPAAKSAPATSKPAALSSDRPAIPKLEFTDTHLANGLRVIIAPEHSAPVYAISVTYNVGARNERPGRTGFAHLFEHMM